MSQYPQSPYSMPYAPPQVGAYPGFMPPAPAELLAPARRAAILQGVLATLMIVFGITCGAMPWFLNMSDLVAQSGAQLPALPPGWTLDELFKLGYTLIGGCGSIFGVTLLVLSFYVRRGGTGPVVTSLVLIGLLLLINGLYVLVCLVQAAGQPAMIVGVFILMMPLALLGMNMLWLFAAARNAGQIAVVRAQYQSQYYGYQQQQQMYAQPQAYMPYPPGYPPAGYATSGYAQSPAAPPQQQPGQQTPAPPSSSAPPSPFDRPPQSGGPDEPPAAGQ